MLYIYIYIYIYQNLTITYICSGFDLSLYCNESMVINKQMNILKLILKPPFKVKLKYCWCIFLSRFFVFKNPKLNWLTNSMAYRTRTFNVAFLRGVQYSLSWAEAIQFLILIPTYLRFILTLSSQLSLGPKGLFPVKNLKVFLSNSILATWPNYPNFLDLISLIRLDEQNKLWSS